VGVFNGYTYRDRKLSSVFAAFSCAASAKDSIYQLSANELQDMTVASGQGIEISTGALAIKENGKISLDRFIVKDSLTEKEVWWGKVNIPFEPKAFDALYKKSHAYLSNKRSFR
jgi:phosphoenolpyruvate carboxykinase (ATP)